MGDTFKLSVPMIYSGFGASELSSFSNYLLHLISVSELGFIIVFSH